MPENPGRTSQPLDTIPADDEIDLLALARTLWRGKLWIMLATLGAAFVGWGYATQVATPMYTAQAVVALENRQGSVVDFQNIMSGMSGDQATINTEVEVLRSRNLIAQVVEEMNLLDDPEFNVFLDAEATAPSDQHAKEVAVSKLLDALSISNVRSSYVFNITAVTTSPSKSANIANTLAELYIQDQIVAKFDATEKATNWLSERAASLKIDLENAEADLKSFISATALTSPEGLEALNKQIKDTRERQDNLRSTRGTLAARVAELEAAQLSGDMTLMLEAASDPSLSRIAESRPADLDNDTFETRFAAVVERAQMDLTRADGQLVLLGQSLANLEANFERQADDLVELQQRQREAEASRAIYEYFLARLKETSVQQGIHQPDSRVLSLATPPSNPSAPRKSRIVALAGILGLMIGAGVVLTREMLHTGFRTAAQIEAETGITVMGQLQKIPEAERSNVIDYLVEKPTSAAAEAVRNLRTSILLSNIDSPPKVILSTSALPGEGKTTIAIALAHNFAGLGKKVLLIEGDIRRRVFAEYFDFDNPNGLLSVLSGATAFSDALNPIKGLGVDVMLGEQSSTNAADLFSSERFAEFMQEARERYDVIIIDAPPVLLVPDARIIAHSADTVLLTVKWDDTARSQVREAARQFTIAGVAITGIVLNQIDIKGMKRYGYGDGYGGYAAYGDKYYDA